MDFRVDLAVFRGPMDLLLYLVRKHEVDILDIPIAPITDQFLEYLAVLQQLDVNAVGDFVAVASMLVEIKSQQVLPRVRRGPGGGRRSAARVGPPALGVQEIPRRGQHSRRARAATGSSIIRG